MVMLDDALLADLTDAQKQAVGHMEGPLLVLAGPGSGKTTVVTRRVANLIAQGVAPWQILALTFTNKAAGEMRERIVKLLPDAFDERRLPTIATFHSFCVRRLRRFAEHTNISANFSIYDAGDQRDAMKRAIPEAGLSTKNWTPASVAAAISNAKNRLLDADGFAGEANDFYTRSIARIYRCYETILRDNDALDFDDLLMRMAWLLRDSQFVREQLQQRYQYLLIDEYQDTNHAQFIIAHALATAHRNICVVGDPDQSIYGWRGADISNILEFEEHYPSAAVIALGQNFRSTGHIVATAAELIQQNRRRKHKRLYTDLGDGEKPVVVVCGSERHEATLVGDFLRRLHDENELPWKEMAVLYRVNALSRVMEEAMREGQIPYVIARGTAFYERKEIKDALAYLRLVVNPNDEVSLRRIINTPARAIGKTTLNKIELFALNNQLRLFEALRRAGDVGDLGARAVTAVAKFVAMIEAWRARPAGVSSLLEPTTPLAQLVGRIIKESGLENMFRRSVSEEDQERLENLDELISAAAQFVPEIDMDDEGEEPVDLPVTVQLAAFLESIALVSDADMIDPEAGAVTLMTLHAAKGLEFEAVAMIGLEENLLPHSRAAANEAELEEERRLCFVGITRAKRQLMLSRAFVRTHRGLRETTIESRFLRELPSGSIVISNQAASWNDLDSGGGGGSARHYERDNPHDDGMSAVDAYPVGSIVRHPKFGLGCVEAITPRIGGTAVRIAFGAVGTKTLVLGYAKLQRVK